MLSATGISSVTTTNKTSPNAAQVGLLTQRGGDTTPYAAGQASAGPTAKTVDVVIVPAGTLPLLSCQSSQSASKVSAQTRLEETAYVLTSRPTLSADISNALEVRASAPSSFNVTGSFDVSLWGIDVEIVDANRYDSVHTGPEHTNVVSDPALGTELTYDSFEQVAQIHIDGSLSISGLQGASVATYASTIQLVGSGTLDVRGASGKIATSPATSLLGADVKASGTFRMTTQRAENVQQLQLESLVGALNVNGNRLPIGQNGPVREATTVSEQPGSAFSAWGFGASIVGLMLVAGVAFGPARTARFNRIETKFENKDYFGVLAKIDPFTHRRRFKRRAAFLKIVSLLSLREYREAGLYLQTLGPQETPEKATKNFLLACVAAGQGQDSQAIHHLSKCLEEDPSYLEEAKTVPILNGYLPYFAFGKPGEART